MREDILCHNTLRQPSACCAWGQTVQRRPAPKPALTKSRLWPSTLCKRGSLREDSAPSTLCQPSTRARSRGAPSVSKPACTQRAHELPKQREQTDGKSWNEPWAEQPYGSNTATLLYYWFASPANCPLRTRGTPQRLCQPIACYAFWNARLSRGHATPDKKGSAMPTPACAPRAADTPQDQRELLCTQPRVIQNTIANTHRQRRSARRDLALCRRGPLYEVCASWAACGAGWP